MKCFTSAIAGLAGLVISACATIDPVTSAEFEPGLAGLEAAAQVMAANENSTLSVRLALPVMQGPHADFIPITERRLEELAVPGSPIYRRVCGRKGLPANCDIEQAIDRIIGTNSETAFPNTVEGARLAFEDVSRFSSLGWQAFIMVEMTPEPASEDYWWNVERLWPQSVGEDYVCISRGGTRCAHRDDIDRLIVFGAGRGGKSDDFQVELTDFEGDLRDHYARAEEIAAAAPVEAHILARMKFAREPHWVERGGVRQVSSVSNEALCARFNMIFDERERFTDCLAWADMDALIVYGVRREPGPLDTLLVATGESLPFQILGAIATATAMGGAGH